MVLPARIKILERKNETPIQQSMAASFSAPGIAGIGRDMGPTPVPGTLNYIEGWVALDGRQLPAKSTNTKVLEANQMLDTQQGKAELLLIPGAFLRIGDQSRMRMISSGLADTRVELLRGSAMLEVDEIYKETNLSIEVDGANARIEKKGLYAFNADRPAVRVLDGKATVNEGDTHVTLKKGREVLLASVQPLTCRKRIRMHSNPMPCIVGAS